MLPPPGFRDVVLCGAGATSRVYRAIDARTGRPLALKRLHRQLAGNADALSRLRRELESLGRLRHSAIVAVRDVIRWQGDPTVVMDFIPGVDLKEAIRARGTLAIEEIERIARVLFDVLSAAHGAGIVHRDVKPQNVRIADDGRIYLLDFGSARLDASSQLTATGTTVGTPEYMPPELFAGSVYDPRVDLYGAGATLFECATGRAPQLAESLTELAYKRTKEDVPPVASLRQELPLHLAQVIDRCLARAPEDRYATASLATWALDHPEVERTFRARRTQRPPCLHCGAPIAPESAVCPACASDHPFAFEAGSSHVVVRGVRDPHRFMEELVARFPERASDEDLFSMAERCAALGHDPQRLVSFVDRDEAAQLVDELVATGVECEVIEDEGASQWAYRSVSLAVAFAGLWSLWAFLEILIPLPALMLFVVPALAIYAWTRAGKVLESEHGILSSARLPAPVVPGSAGVLAAGAAALFSLGLVAPTVALKLVVDEADAMMPAIIGSLRSPLWVGAAACGGAFLASLFARLARPSRSHCGSPEPRLREKLARAFQTSRGALAHRMGGGAAVAVLSVVCMLVPVELYGLGLIRSVDNTSTWLYLMRETEGARSMASDVANMFTRAGEPITDPPEALSPEFTRALKHAHRRLPRPEERPPPVEETDSPPPLDDLGDWGTRAPSSALAIVPRHDTPEAIVVLALDALFLLGGAGAIALFALRRKRIAAEARAILAALDRSRLGPAKSGPISRSRTREVSDADRLALAPASNAFSVEARRRAAELAHHLSDEDVARLRRALEAMARTDRVEVVKERSLLARCIAETDPEQRLRFELLALEGEMESAAALAWAARIGEDEP